MTTTSNGTLPRSLSRDKPCYLLHKDVVRANFARLTEAFKSRYENFAIAYSFKTNYLKDIVQIASDSGCMAEIVSPHEFRYAQKTGMFDDMRIVYNGVIRDAKAKVKLAANGGYVNVDNYAELE